MGLKRREKYEKKEREREREREREWFELMRQDFS